MPADFEKAVAFVLEHEGGLSDHSADPGGITNHGISLRFLRKLGSLALGDIDRDGDIDPDDIRKMSQSEAKRIYRAQWWERYGYGDLRQRTAAKLFDTAVNVGPFVAHKLAQEALNDCGIRVDIDGRIGPITKAALNRVAEDMFISNFKQEQEAHYRALARLNPDFAVFLRGWVRRARSG